MADQLGAAQLGCYGSGVDSTPTLDSLATEGTLFSRCYATTPVCAPNRANLLTGRSPCVHGMISNNYALATDTPTYARVLQQQGYRTGGFGKFHQHPMPLGLPESADYLGFTESVLSEDPKWGPYLDWVEREHGQYFEQALAMAWGPPPGTPPERIGQWQQARVKVLEPIKQQARWGMVYASPLPAEVHDTTFLTEMGLDFLHRHRRGHANEPFFCHVSYVDPHDPYDPPEPYASMFDPGDMREPLPPSWDETRMHSLDNARGFFGGEREATSDMQTMRELRAKFHGSLKFLDDQIARLVAYLKDNGLWEETILVFTTDHGEMLGDHRLMTKGVKPYDAGIRCPLLVAGGGVSTGTVDELTCTLDFFPTFCDWAEVGLEQRPPLEGRSFAPLCAGQTQPEPWPHVAVALGGVQTVISDDNWRLTRFLRDNVGQLFHLIDDPSEQHDLYDDPAHAGTRQEMLERLVDAATMPHRVPHYRNLPVIDGHKHTLGGKGNGQLIPAAPLFNRTAAPALT